MSRAEWFVCERSNRWVSAMRLGLAAEGSAIRLREIRSLSELAAELSQRPPSLAAIEVYRGNFADVLAWLPNARRQFVPVRHVALLDRSLAEFTTDVCDALVEAGAEAVCSSPRRLDAVLALQNRHARAAERTNQSIPLAERVWASLPWQES